MLPNAEQKPRFTLLQAKEVAERLYGLEGTLSPLPSERDQNYLVSTRDKEGESYVLKIAGTDSSSKFLEAQNQALLHIKERDPHLPCPKLLQTLEKESIGTLEGPSGQTHLVRAMTYLPGALLAKAEPHEPALLFHLGQVLGRLDQALGGFTHPGLAREFQWDLRGALKIEDLYLDHIEDTEKRNLVRSFFKRFRDEVLEKLSALPQGVIHNDANDFNVVVSNSGHPRRITGLLDFGDMVEGSPIFDAAVGAAYALLNKVDPITSSSHVISGYHSVRPIVDLELELLPALISIRLCLSVTLCAVQRKNAPHNEYLSVSEKPAWTALAQLGSIPYDRIVSAYRKACNSLPVFEHHPGESPKKILSRRSRHLGGSLGVSYQEPLKIVRGSGQYLYDAEGWPFLDVVNNVSHVGHCHPRVVRAASDQMERLNTNTRYLHDYLVRYAERLANTLPDPLEVCFFVCSGSEANDLAWRLSRAHTRGTEAIVVSGAYHGNLSSLIDFSPYKYDGPGGTGRPGHVHQVAMPDPYRGPHRDPRTAGEEYAASVGDAITDAESRGKKIAGFYCESLLGCGGQVVLPPGYLAHAFDQVRRCGGLCIADEVQVGFGRVGTHFWGFETQGVVPDIVTLGKPIGNGHPLAAVVTTKEIADSFNNGMEYFNTYGGNPVSCAVGLAVLDVIADERLQENARCVGERMKTGLTALLDRHPLIGDVRGLGLFLGVELVRNRETFEPAAAEASRIVENLRRQGILLSTDGPLHNVIKMKPPLIFSELNADHVVAKLDQALFEEEMS